MTKTKYQCPKCTNTIEVFVTLVTPPVCNSNHFRGGVTMKEIKEENNDAKA